MRKTLANEALQTTAASPGVIERSECMLFVSGLSAAVSELARSAPCAHGARDREAAVAH